MTSWLVMAGGNDVLFNVTSLSGQISDASDIAMATSVVTQLAAGATNPLVAAQAIRAAMATERAKPAATTESIFFAAVTVAAAQPGNAAVATAAVYGPIATQARTDGVTAGLAYLSTHSPDLIAALAQAGADLAGLIKQQMVAKGAKHIVVNNLSDLASTPSSLAQPEPIRRLIDAMVGAFNMRLAADLGAMEKYC